MLPRIAQGMSTRKIYRTAFGLLSRRFQEACGALQPETGDH
jgi:hypothetical protein